MKFDIKKTKKIEAYLDGALTNKEVKEFEEELIKNKELQTEVEIHNDIRSGLNTKGNNKLREELENYYHDYFKNKDKNKNSLVKYLVPAVSIAASIILFLFIFIRNNEKPDNPDNYITLDSVKINKSSSYADSATYKTENDSIQ